MFVALSSFRNSNKVLVFDSTPASSTTKSGRHDIAEILLKVALNTKKQSINQAKQTGVSVCLLQVLK
jgi:hypothetical protein